MQTNDANLDYYYDFTQSIAEYTKVFAELHCKWHWQPVTITNYQKTIAAIIAAEKNPFFINLCDGDDTNDVPGVNVIKELNKYIVPYTGADVFFYTITTSKIPMKKALDAYGVPNAKWKVINDNKATLENLQTPVLLKPAVSGGSMGVSIKNVVYTNENLQQRITEMQQGYRGWNLMVDGVFAEEFIIGEEYTTFIIGNYHQPDGCIVYEPVWRKFHYSLPPTEQFLSFDRLWEIYEEEQAMPNNANFYEYEAVPNAKDISQLKQLTVDAFIACRGIGYARADFRKDATTGKIYCLEINAQCGLSEDENFTSIGAIIKYSGVSFTEIIQKIIEETLRRFAK